MSDDQKKTSVREEFLSSVLKSFQDDIGFTDNAMRDFFGEDVLTAFDEALEAIAVETIKLQLKESDAAALAYDNGLGIAATIIRQHKAHD